MGYSVSKKVVEALESQINKLQIENINMDAERAFWKRQAIINGSAAGEEKFKNAMNQWIPTSLGILPEEKISPVTNDYYEYECTFNSGDVLEVRFYKFGDGHWWHGGSIVDKYITAWRNRLEPWKEDING